MSNTFGLVACLVVGLVVVAISLLTSAVRVVQEYERGVIFRLGRLVGAKGPGLFFLVPVIDRMVKMDLRVITLDIPSQEMITADNVTVKVNAVAYFRVIDPERAVVQVEDYFRATSQIAQTSLRSVIGEASLDELTWAARQAYAHDFIQALPQGYNTVVGERGARLSAGQAQRIALARAFLKDAPLLILDEATSNLDPEHETRLLAAMERLMLGRTVLIIAHRLSTIFRADQVLVMAGGRLVEAGTHTSLWEEDGLYRRLASAYGAPG